MSAAPASTSEPRIRLGRYTLISEIARGTFGRLWTAYSRKESGEAEPVLIRRLPKKDPLDEAALEEIHRAAGLAISLRAEHVAHIIAIEQGDTELGIVFEYAEGKDLRSLATLAPLKHVRMPTGVAVQIATSSLAALTEVEPELPEELRTAALWPDSVFVRGDGKIRLLDVGVAAAIARTELPGKISQLIGYCAPEEFEGGRLSRSDVFRAGVMLWEMLSGKRLFSGHTVKATIEQVLNAPIPALEWPDPEAAYPKLERVIKRALERDPMRRYPSNAAMIAALEECGVSGLNQIDVSEYVHELVATGLAAQQRAVETALAEAGTLPEEEKKSEPKSPEPKSPELKSPEPKSAGLKLPELKSEPKSPKPKWPELKSPELNAPELKSEPRSPGLAVFPMLGGASSTTTLIGVPEPGVLPARRALPPPPRRVLPPIAPSAPLDIESLDSIEEPLRESVPDITENSSNTLVEPVLPLAESDAAATGGGAASVTELMDMALPAAAPLPAVEEAAPADSSRSHAAVESDEPVEAGGDARPLPIERKYLIGAAAAAGVLLLSVVVFAFIKSGNAPATDAAATASASATSEGQSEQAPALAGASAAASAVEAPMASASAAPSAAPADSAAPTAVAAAKPAPAVTAPKPAPVRTSTATKSSSTTQKSTLTAKQKADAKKKADAAKAKKKKSTTTSNTTTTTKK